MLIRRIEVLTRDELPGKSPQKILPPPQTTPKTGSYYWMIRNEGESDIELFETNAGPHSADGAGVVLKAGYELDLFGRGQEVMFAVAQNAPSDVAVLGAQTAGSGS